MTAAKRILIQTGPSSEERARADRIGSQRSSPCSAPGCGCVALALALAMDESGRTALLEVMD